MHDATLIFPALGWVRAKQVMTEEEYLELIFLRKEISVRIRPPVNKGVSHFLQRSICSLTIKIYKTSNSTHKKELSREKLRSCNRRTGSNPRFYNGGNFTFAPVPSVYKFCVQINI